MEKKKKKTFIRFVFCPPGDAVHFNSDELVRVLLAGRRNHSADVTRRSAARKVSHLRHDPRLHQVSHPAVQLNWRARLSIGPQ